jgi:hypothetical protein
MSTINLQNCNLTLYDCDLNLALSIRLHIIVSKLTPTTMPQ